MVAWGTGVVLLMARGTVALLMDVSRRDAMNAQIRQNSNLALSLRHDPHALRSAGR